MARTITTTTTAKQRRAQAEALQESIIDQVEQLRHSDQWQRFLDFAQAFHPYSLGNLLLILAQCPTATHVAGFRTWQSLNRQVRKGERGIRIFGFRQKKITGDPAEGEEVITDDSGQKTVTYYPMLSVFDLAQTDIIDPDIVDPQVITQRLTGDDLAGILTATTDYLHGLGWTVEHQPISGDTNGYTTMDGSRRVIIDADLSPAQAAKTALHEAAHVLLHAGEEHADYIEHRGARDRSGKRCLHRRRDPSARHRRLQHRIRRRMESRRHRDHQSHRRPGTSHRTHPRRRPHRHQYRRRGRVAGGAPGAARPG